MSIQLRKSLVLVATIALAFVAAMVFAVVVFACVGDVSQIVQPSSVDVDVTVPGSTGVDTGTDVPIPTPGTLRMVLEPSVVTLSTPSPVVVQVIILDSKGNEVPSENISVNIDDPLLVGLKDIDGRFVSFELKAPGTTRAIITASGVQGVLVFNLS